jgi:hypothetical protein
LQPTTSRYSSIWDSDILHRYLDSLGEDKGLASGTLAAKLTALLLLHCFVRFTEMAAICLGKVGFSSENDVSFTIISKTDQLKDTTIQASSVCTAAAARRVSLCMHEYVSRLRSAKFNCTAATPLFTDMGSGLPYPTDRLRDMAKSLMAAAGIDTVRFTAYSLKAAGISRRASAGESITELENASRLSHKSGTLRKFYLRQVTTH